MNKEALMKLLAIVANAAYTAGREDSLPAEKLVVDMSIAGEEIIFSKEKSRTDVITLKSDRKGGYRVAKK